MRPAGGRQANDLRHTVVSLLLELDTHRTSCRRSPGTPTSTSTMRIYTHTNLDSMREAVDKIDWGAA